MSTTSLSFTQLPEASQFNSKNLTTWRVKITEIISGKGLWGYVDESIPCLPTAQMTQGTAPTTTPLPLDPTPLYSSTLSSDEWKFQDSHICSHIILNISDPIGLGVKMMGSAKEAWDSIIDTYAVQNEMALSKAQCVLQNTKYTEGADMEAHIQDLCTKCTAVDNLSESGCELTDKDFRGVIVCSLPHTVNWLPILPSLYQCKTSVEIISLLQTHYITLYPTKPDMSFALNAKSSTGKWCINPECKAHKCSTHNVSDCYWPGGGKEGQFPENFGRNRWNNQANNTSSNTQAGNTTPQANLMVTHIPHIAFMVHVMPIDEDDVEVYTGEGNGACTFDEPSDDEMPHLEDVDVEDTPTESDFEEVTISSMSDFDMLDLEEINKDELNLSLFKVEEFICDTPVADKVYVSTTFQGWKPTKSLHFLDSGASDHFLRDLKGFMEYMPQPYHTRSSAKQVEGGFSILGVGTASKLFHCKSGEKKLVRLMFKNTLYAPSLAANLISVSTLDATRFYTTFGGHQAVIKDRNGAKVFTGQGENRMYVLECVDEAEGYRRAWQSESCLISGG
ncbi:uncharacterized protein ARMOST_16721 [Armillaria ostoyae]|uniref:Retrovirus-related Pol polyprotein from transposon TNT 1-94-like beta-barrel domain-containing protein n=1 Tax=Armillaria ostoyae TaxID=47428 RepID=A0A284RX05_ARMOS|nr:uncharacterized protein ARMOST_16721 [Armillaria ostoyae]